MRLNVVKSLPASVAELPATALADALGGPTLFDLRKPGVAPLFVSVLMHGNEVSGWDAVRRLAPRFAEASALVFVGNVEAARAGRRMAPGGIDFNRVWEGGDTPESAVAEAVADIAEQAEVRLAVDLHNNTGRNPPYSVVCRTDRRTLDAARAFSAHALYSRQPRGFQTRRFARFCTALTVEVGVPSEPRSTARAVRFLSALLDGSAPRPGAAVRCGLAVFETVARVYLAPDALLDPAAQRFNFRMAPAGAPLTRAGAVTAADDAGRDVSDRYLAAQGGAAVLRRPMRLAMYTGDAASARQDCLCYLLEPVAAGF